VKVDVAEVTSLCSELLGTEVAPGDDLPSAGADSFFVAHLATAIYLTWGVHVPPAALFELVTTNEIAMELQRRLTSSADETTPHDDDELRAAQRSG
jgi:hypothetical protein